MRYAAQMPKCSNLTYCTFKSILKGFSDTKVYIIRHEPRKNVTQIRCLHGFIHFSGIALCGSRVQPTEHPSSKPSLTIAARYTEKWKALSRPHVWFLTTVETWQSNITDPVKTKNTLNLYKSKLTKSQ